MKKKDVVYEVGDILVWKSYGKYFTVLSKKDSDNPYSNPYSTRWRYVMLDMKSAEVVEFWESEVHTTAWKKKG
jgi:hypothetical protein